MTSFNDGFRAGIEAAATWHETLASMTTDEALAAFHKAAAIGIRALTPAAPEPSEADVERVREAVKRALGEIGFMDPEWRGSDADADKVARAALAAMGRGDGLPDFGRRRSDRRLGGLPHRYDAEITI